jgi:hypothetical protein
MAGGTTSQRQYAGGASPIVPVPIATAPTSATAARVRRGLLELAMAAVSQNQLRPGAEAGASPVTQAR